MKAGRFVTVAQETRIEAVRKVLSQQVASAGDEVERLDRRVVQARREKQDAAEEYTLFCRAIDHWRFGEELTNRERRVIEAWKIEEEGAKSWIVDDGILE